MQIIRVLMKESKRCRINKMKLVKENELAYFGLISVIILQYQYHAGTKGSIEDSMEHYYYTIMTW